MSQTQFQHGFCAVKIGKQTEQETGTKVRDITLVSEGVERDVQIHIFRDVDSHTLPIDLEIEADDLTAIDIEPGRFYRVPAHNCLHDRGIVYVLNVYHTECGVIEVEGFWFDADYRKTREEGRSGATFATPGLDPDRPVVLIG